MNELDRIAQVVSEAKRARTVLRSIVKKYGVELTLIVAEGTITRSALDQVTSIIKPRDGINTNN